MALTNIKRVYYQGKICAYFKNNGHALRYKLYKIDKQYLNTRLRVKPSFTTHDYNIVNEEIDSLEESVDKIITQIIFDNLERKITAKLIDYYLANPKSNTATNSDIESTTSLEDPLILNFDRFNKEMKARKRKEYEELGRDERRHPSTKDYTSTRNALDDYQYDLGEVLFLKDINEVFVERFIDYLVDSRESSSGHKYKTQGELTNATINKRLDCLATFIRHFYKDSERAKMITSNKLSNKKIDVIRLTKEELRQLAELNVETETENRIRDFFVFVCLTGLRFSDLITIKRSNFFLDPTNPTLRLFTQKTMRRAEIPLIPRAISLAEKYNYDFSYYTNAAFNRGLKALLDKYDLFNERADKIIQQKKKTKTIQMLKRDRISAHAGRRTFISQMVESDVPISIIMGMTGHTKISTLQIYIDKFSPKATEAIAKSSLNF